MDIFYYFIYKAIELLNYNGVLSFITTNYWLINDDATKLRSTIKTKMTVLRLINFNDYKIFHSALGQNNLIIEAEKSHKRHITTTLNVKRKGIADALSFNRIIDGRDKSGVSFNKINSFKLFNGPKDMVSMSYGVNAHIDHIINNLSDNFDSLANYITSCMGITGDPNKIFILSKNEYKAIESYLNQYELNMIYPLINGSSMNKYFEHNFDNYIIYSTKNTDIHKAPYLFHYIQSKKRDMIQREKLKVGNLLRDPNHIIC